MPDAIAFKPRGSHQHIKQNKRIRKFSKIALWRDNWELESVGRALVSAVDPVLVAARSGAAQSLSIEDAFDTVSIWKARAQDGEGLPHAVESTFHLARVYWRDKSGSKISTTEIRLGYSSAIVRTINGFADALQQQRSVASSVSLLCSKLGIPAWIVDIRHEASHNALPSLGILRLAACTLMEFLKSQYWIPMCDNWKPEEDAEDGTAKVAGEGNSNVTLENTNETKLPIDYLLAYKACAASFFSTQSNNDNAATGVERSISKQQAPNQFVANLPSFDPVFGEADSDEDDWEDPILGSVRGNYIGTSSNRFSLLEPPKSKSSKRNDSKTDKNKSKIKKKKQKRNGQPTAKKKPGEKYPMDHAKDFVTAVSPREGFSTALLFLVWGGNGASPSGRGVLIPGSTSAFPATNKGVLKCWKRYSPLLEVMGRVWPGFCSSLLVHLVDFVLSIEESSIEQKQRLPSGDDEMDAGSARKLFFLSSWIRLLLSQQYISNIDHTYVPSKSGGSKKNGSIELALAELPYLEKLGYPLNAIADRCVALEDSCNAEMRTTSRSVLRSVEEILGESRVANFGIHTASQRDDPSLSGGQSFEGRPPAHSQSASVSAEHGDAANSVSSRGEIQLEDGAEGRNPSSPTKPPGDPVEEGAAASAPMQDAQNNATSGMSLEEMEALLHEGDSLDAPMGAAGSGEATSTTTPEPREAASPDARPGNDESLDGAAATVTQHVGSRKELAVRHEPSRRMAWVRCSSWDPCSLGTLPGHPI